MKYYCYLLLFLVASGTISCTRNIESAGANQKVAYQVAEPEVQDQTLEEPPPPGNDGVNIDRKLIKEGTIEYRVENLFAARDRLLDATTRWKGYISNESEYKTSDRNSTTLMIRVPAQAFDSLLADATIGIAQFERKEIKVMDVTEAFVDVEARLKTKKEIESRYLGLLNRANTVKDVLEVEKELGVLRADIESMEGRLNLLKSEVSYATLNITMYEVVSAPTYFIEKVVAGFANGWDYLLAFIVGLVNLWPFLVIAATTYIGFRRWKSGRRSQKVIA